MSDTQRTFERQAAWQRARKSLPWPEKIRMVEAIRDSIVLLRRSSPHSENLPSATPPGERSVASTPSSTQTPDPD
jgi:hypothetical protein